MLYYILSLDKLTTRIWCNLQPLQKRGRWKHKGRGRQCGGGGGREIILSKTIRLMINYSQYHAFCIESLYKHVSKAARMYTARWLLLLHNQIVFKMMKIQDNLYWQKEWRNTRDWREKEDRWSKRIKFTLIALKLFKIT